jgi:hypothetical protein
LFAKFERSIDIMKKFSVFLLLSIFLIGGGATTASAALLNLIENPGFETNNGYGNPTNPFNEWEESGNYGLTSYSRTGSYAARLSDGGIGGATNSQMKTSDPFRIDLTTLGTYEFGAWFTIKSTANPDDFYNNDRVGVTVDLGGPYPNQIYDVSGAPVSSWTYFGNPHYGYMSEWIYIGGTFDLTSPVNNVEFLFYIQNYTTTYGTSVYVDDAWLARVPEPATMLLLGFGIVGLAGFGRKKFLKK